MDFKTSFGNSRGAAAAAVANVGAESCAESKWKSARISVPKSVLKSMLNSIPNSMPNLILMFANAFLVRGCTPQKKTKFKDLMNKFKCEKLSFWRSIGRQENLPYDFF